LNRRSWREAPTDEVASADVFIHGGGWIAGNIDSSDRLLEVAIELEADILGIE